MNKNIPALLLALLLAVSLVGCGKQEEYFQSGHISARTYENPLLGLQCIVPADWEFLTESELLQLSKVVLTEEGGEKDVQLTAHLQSGGNVQDMYARTEDGLQSINVMVRKFDPETQAPDMAGFADLGMKEVEQVYRSMGITEVVTGREQVLFLDEQCEAIRLGGAYEDVPLYSLQLCLLRGEYVCVVTFTSYVEDNTEMMMKFFHPLIAEEQ